MSTLFDGYCSPEYLLAESEQHLRRRFLENSLDNKTSVNNSTAGMDLKMTMESIWFT